MSEFRVASRYAKALIDLAEEQNALEAIHSDMQVVVDVVKSNPQLQAVLRNPIIKLDKKANILKEIFGKSAHPVLLSFFDILVSKGRAGTLIDTATQFISQYNQKKGIVEATVRSAVPLSQVHKDQLIDLISKQYSNHQVILSNEVDSSLIGGFILTVGDKQIDASIAGKLNELEQHFAKQVV